MSDRIARLRAELAQAPHDAELLAELASLESPPDPVIAEPAKPAAKKKAAKA